MNIKLNWIHLKNFKGIKDFKLVAEGKNVSVFADNGKGKTTIQDAWNWLLFDKDSNNIADTKFTIKPQDKQGKGINHLQTEVEAELLIDGKTLKLKKLREEKWVTRRGTTEPVMDGHVKKYWFNEVPCKAKEYQFKVDELVNENVFKMITDPLFFNTKLKWEDRRKILLEISGDKTDEEVISSDESLSKLKEILNGKSIDEYKLVVADKLKNLKKERDNIPPRIDELTLSLPQEEPDYATVENELKGHKDMLQGIELLLTNSTKKANEINKKYQLLTQLKTQLEEVKTKVKAESGADKTKLVEKKAELESGRILLESGISTLKMQIDQAERTLKNNSEIRQKMIEEWQKLNSRHAEIKSRQFKCKEDIGSICPTCGQELPEELIQHKIGDLEKAFKKELKEDLDMTTILLEQNIAEGKALKANTKKTQSDLEVAEKELSEKQSSLEKLKKQLSELEEEISKPVAEPDYTKYPDYNELLEKIKQLQAELEKPVEDKSNELLQKKASVQVQIDECNKILNSKAETEKKKDRIEELKAEEKRVSALIAELEGHKFLLEQFVVTKVNLLEDSINSQFKHVKFKLFEENITNEGVKETCIALVNTNGAYVKYEDGNLAGRINAGLDIINSLCRFYGVTALIFIDNRESVSEIMGINSQVINLVKPPTWKELDPKVQLALAGVEGKEIYTEEDKAKLETAKKAWNGRNKILRVEVEK